MTYVEELVADLEVRLPWGQVEAEERRIISCFYALLVLSKGTAITAEDVHDAWATAMTARRAAHRSLVPYRDLDDRSRSKDEPFAKVLRAAGGATEAGDQR